MSTYYWKKRDWIYEARQTRFKQQLEQGTEHPHDVCAVATNEEQQLTMQKLLGGTEAFENPVGEQADDTQS